MIIKNEKTNLEHFLLPIYDLFDDVVVVDTGSTDGSIDLLRDNDISVISYDITHTDRRLVEARNLSIEKNKCDRVFILDGDEEISREDLLQIKKINESDDVYGYFIKRVDYRYNKPFEDYKMALINKHKVRFLFSVHACPQAYVRDNRGLGMWLNGVEIRHHQKPKDYRKDYVLQLENGVSENPACMRFFRFLGYYYFKHNYFVDAKNFLGFVCESQSTRFPVETLNAYMIFACILQNEGSHIQSYSMIDSALLFRERVQDDFEVRINFRLYNWLKQTQQNLLDDPQVAIVPYEFAF